MFICSACSNLTQRNEICFIFRGVIQLLLYAYLQYFMSRYNPVKGLFGSWLTPDLYREGGATGYKAMGWSHLHDSITIIINTINLPSCQHALPVQT